LESSSAILFAAASKRYTTATSEQYHRNIRGDKTPLELFLAGIRGWEAGLRRQFDNGKSKQD
jgi:hypothetical protein